MFFRFVVPKERSTNTAEETSIKAQYSPILNPKNGLILDVREETMKDQAVKVHLRKLEKLGFRYFKSTISKRNEVDALLEMTTIENVWKITGKEEIEEDVLQVLHFQWKYMTASNNVKAEIQKILRQAN